MISTLTAAECDNEAERVCRDKSRAAGQHVAHRKQQQLDVQEEECEEKHPRAPHSCKGEDHCENEPRPTEHPERIVEVRADLASLAVGVSTQDASTGEVDHRIAEIEGCVRRKDRRAERVACDELHDAGDELANPAEKHDDTDEDVGRLDPTGMHAEDRDEEDASREGQQA